MVFLANLIFCAVLAMIFEAAIGRSQVIERQPPNSSSFVEPVKKSLDSTLKFVVYALPSMMRNFGHLPSYKNFLFQIHTWAVSCNASGVHVQLSMLCTLTVWIALRVLRGFLVLRVLVYAFSIMLRGLPATVISLTMVCFVKLSYQLHTKCIFSGQSGGIHGAAVNPEYTNIDAIDRDEQETLMEDVANYLQSIVD